MDIRSSIFQRIVLITFIMGMGALASSFYFIDHQKAHDLAIEKVVQEYQAKLDLVMRKQQADLNRFVDALSSTQRRSAGFMETTPVPPIKAPPVPLLPQLAETTFEISEIKIKFTESSSWTTVFKILTTILGTFLGIKIINAAFAWIDRRAPKARRRRA
jgi:hypothetical protein